MDLRFGNVGIRTRPTGFVVPRLGGGAALDSFDVIAHERRRRRREHTNQSDGENGDTVEAVIGRSVVPVRRVHRHEKADGCDDDRQSARSDIQRAAVGRKQDDDRNQHERQAERADREGDFSNPKHEAVEEGAFEDEQEQPEKTETEAAEKQREPEIDVGPSVGFPDVGPVEFDEPIALGGVGGGHLAALSGETL